MVTSEKNQPEWSLFGAVGAAIAASACCTIPLVLVSLGVGGAWMSRLTALEPYRPIFIVLAVGLMGIAFVRSYKSRHRSDCDCQTGMKSRTTKMLLGLAALMTLGLIASPWLLPGLMHFHAAREGATPGQSQEVVLSIENMSCPSCTTTVKTTLNRTDGVLNAEVTYTPPRAVITYNPSKIGTEGLITAILNTGYQAHVYQIK
jgi:copper chaperone CopZ